MKVNSFDVIGLLTDEVAASNHYFCMSVCVSDNALHCLHYLVLEQNFSDYNVIFMGDMALIFCIA